MVGRKIILFTRRVFDVAKGTNVLNNLYFDTNVWKNSRYRKKLKYGGRNYIKSVSIIKIYIDDD